MESALGHDFSQVRVHTDSKASELSDSLNARAFTIGSDVAFSAGEYQPGTLAGDALLAHELAHVAQQQGGGAAASGPIEGPEYEALEENADAIAAGAVASLWMRGGATLANIGRNAIPRLRSGLRLSRCKTDGCVTGNLRVVTSGSLEGGLSANDYLGGGASWAFAGAGTTAGVDGTSNIVQMVAPFAGKQNLGVSQTLQHGASNQAFLDGTAAYLGRAAGSVNVGDVISEPVLDAADPFATRNWFLRYHGASVSFSDAPGAGPGDQGYIDFVTCFHSRARDCAHSRCCVTWRWTVDYTAGNTTNTVTQQSQTCT
jgi:hypothetical protein